jgi:hypothetical protein
MRAFLAAIDRQNARRQLDRIDAAVITTRAESKDLVDLRRRLERLARGQD